MSVTELKLPESSTYVQIQTKLASAFDINELCKEGVVDWLTENGFEKAAFQVQNCGTKAVSLQCSNGHQKRVRMTCHKEYCPRCGKKDSLLHRRSKVRAYDRLIWSDLLGYMVFTLPRVVSDSMPSKEQLSKIEKEAVKIVKDNFSTPGCMVRAHLMGEEPEYLHIHVNVLFPIVDTSGQGRVEQATLDNIRQHWTTFVNQAFGLKNKTTNVFYKFATSKIKMKHLIKYVTRPIVTAERFLTLSNEARFYCLSLRGWHNTRWYGQLANCKYKEYLKSKGLDLIAHREEDIALAKKCPICNERYKFIEIIDIDNIPESQFRRLSPDVWIDLETHAFLKNKASP